MCPIKYPSSEAELRWSKWIEALRKDVECAFGIMKGRFRILKTGIRLHGTEAVDDLWATCCALHNMLLEADGLSAEWENGVKSDWEGEMGNHDAADIPMIFRRVGGSATTDLSGMGRGGDEDMTVRHFGAAAPPSPAPAPAANANAAAAGPAPTPVRSLSLREFRGKLIEHFEILWGRREVVWPSRNGVME